jgi:Ca-activated chloride channel family protein
MSAYKGMGRGPWGVAVVALAVVIFGVLVYAATRPCPDPIFPWHCPQTSAAPPAGTATLPPNAIGQEVVISFYTSDTKANWINDVTADFNAAGKTTPSGQRIRVDVTQGDSGDLKEELLAGQIQPTVFSPGEMSWVNEADEVWQQRENRRLVTGDCPPTAIAAIGFGMWKPMAEAMGWPDQPIGWKEIIDLANDPDGWGRYGHPEWGPFKFGHTHPLESNTGRLAIISLAYWALGRTDGLTPELVKSPSVITAIQQLELHTEHYGDSTRQLFARMVELGPGYLSAGTTSETNLLITNSVNKDNPNLWSPLVFIIPSDGAFWSNNPYCVLDADWVTAEQREAAQVYKEYLLAEDQQRIAMQVHGLRPTNPRVALGPLIDLASGTDPNDTPENVPTLATVSGATAQAVEDVFIAAKKKAIIVVVLDTSASMLGEKIKGATGATADFLKLLAQKDKDDEVHVLTFSNQVMQLTPGGRVGDVVEPLKGKVATLFPEGGTALYDAICQAAGLVQGRQADYEAAGEQRLPGIIVLSDGEDTSSANYTQSDVFNFCLPKGEDVESFPVYAIAYGADAQEDFLIQIANFTHGRFYAADETSLPDIYNGIAYEQ